jgi:cytochrome c-type biogenesis protein CcmI
MVIFGALVLVGLAVFLILQPIVASQEAPQVGSGEEPTEAQFRKRVFLLQLRDAEYEYAMGKLGDEDYQILKKEISAEALAAIKAEQAEMEEEGGPTQVSSDSDLEEEIAQVRARLGKGVFCSECGYPNAAGSRFCAECGSAIPVPEPSNNP